MKYIYGLLIVSVTFVGILAFLQFGRSQSPNADEDIPKRRVARSPSPDKDGGLFGDIYGMGGEDLGGGSGVIKKKDDKKSIGFLPLPPGYNKLAIPLGNISSSIYIMVHLSIREILDVDTNNGIVEMDTELGIFWIDWEIWNYFIRDKDAREKARYGPEEITLDAEFLRDIWKPDIFIEEMASVERTSLLSKLITLKFLVRNDVMPGAITFQARQTFKVRCDMDFKYYPADTQKCELNIRSYSYPQDKLFLLWNPSQRVFLDQLSDSNFDFQVSGVEPGEELYDLFTTSQATCCTPQNYSTLTFNLEIRRDLTYHFVQTCLPSILLILITWLCFLLPPDMVEARIGISMTTLLTLTAMFAAVREQSPDVSYPMAIDYWMVFCIFLLFIALLLFTFMYWLRRKLAHYRDAKEKAAATTNGTANGTNGEAIGLEMELAVHQAAQYKQIVGHMRKYSFILFAWIFLLFLILFPLWLLLSSEYYTWSPNPRYNAMPLEDEDDDSNRLYTKQEKKFKPTAKKKVIESEFRFRDIHRDVISPKLKELGLLGESEEEEYYEEEATEASAGASAAETSVEEALETTMKAIINELEKNSTATESKEMETKTEDKVEEKETVKNNNSTSAEKTE